MAEPMHASRTVRRNRGRFAAPPALRVVPGNLRARPDLLRSTALQAVFLAALVVPGTVLAQGAATTLPAATALPTGGKVIAGTASIATTTAPGSASMTVKQATGYGAYDWKSFDIGKSASVTYQVPNSQAISVNRVISPTSPSIIAGKLNSNGVLVVQNQSGVVFTQGAEVNVNTLIATAPGLSDANARAGKLIFDQPANAGARVENHGTITVAQTGLAALVAPQVANSGVIRANMARVVLAGAEAHTVDLYGDGLLAIDVTQQVTQVPVGADGKAATALVTNSGTILADGGTVLLTASAVDGLVQNLVTAGGTVQANTAGASVGRVAVRARGGNVTVTGTIAATGVAAGSKGGQIEINAPARSVTVKAGAKVDASGRAGGGSIAVGTTLARGGGRTTVKEPTAQFVILESGARVAADATQAGNGGDVVLLSSGGATAQWGDVSARGGPAGGNGGFVEVSGDSFFLGGALDTSAPGGTYGTVLLDPTDLTIGTPSNKTVAPNSDTFTTADIEAGTTLDPANIVSKMKGEIVLATGAGGTLTVASALDVTANGDIKSVTLQSDGDLKVNAPITGGDNITLTNKLGNMTIAAAVTTADGKTITLNSAGSIALNGNITSDAGIIELNAGAGGISQLAGTALLAGTVQSGTGIAGDVALTSTANKIGALGAMTIAGGNLSVVNAVALDIKGTVTLAAGKTASFATTGFTVSGKLDTTATGTVELAPSSGAMSLGKGGGELEIVQGTLANITAGTLQLGKAGAFTASGLVLNEALDTSAATTTRLFAGAGGVVLKTGPLTAGTLDVTAAGGGITDNGQAIKASTLLSSGGITGDVVLNTTVQNIDALGDMVVTGDLRLSAAGALKVAGKVQVSGEIGLSSASATAAAIDITGTLAQTVAGKTTALITAAGGGIAVSGTLDTTPGGTLTLSAGTKGVAQSGGVVTTGTLAGASAASVNLAQAGNAIGGVGALTVTGGDLVVTSGAAIAVTGAVVADNVTLTGSAKAADAVSVAASGSIVPGAGGAVALTASDAGAGGIVLSGTVEGTGAIGLSAGAGGIALGSRLATTGTIDVSAGTGGVTQSAGSIKAAGLVSSGGIGGTATLAMAANEIGATGAIKVTGGDLILATKAALKVDAALEVGIGKTLSLAVGGLPVPGGALSAVGGTVEITTLDGSTMSLGTAAAAELAITNAHLAKISSATLRLGGAVAVAGVTADSLVFQDAVTLGTAGTAVLRLDAGAAGIALKSGVLTANTLDLNAAGGGVSGAGTIAATLLQSSAGVTGDVALAGTTHSVVGLGGFAVSKGAFALKTDKALGISGTVSATAIKIESTNASASAISLTGALNALDSGAVDLLASNAAGGIVLAGGVDTKGTLSLAAGTGGVVQTSGTLIAGTVATTSKVGALSLAGADNQFAVIADISATGDVTIASSVATTTSGKVESAANVTLTSSADNPAALSIAGLIDIDGTATLSATKAGGGIALSGTLDATAGVDLSAGTGGIVQSGGAVITTSLFSTAGSGGSVTLTQAGNKVDAIGAFAVTGKSGFALATASGLAVGGVLSTANGNIALDATDPASGITLAANVTAGGGTLDLSAGTGGVKQTAGAVSAAVLASSKGIGGPVGLGQPGNAIGAIGTLAVSGGGFSLINTVALSVDGALSATGGGVVLDVTDAAGKGGLQVPGTISGDAITLVGRGATGAIGIGGTLTTAGTLDVSVTGAGGVSAGGTLDVDVLRSTQGVVGGFTATNAANRIGTIDVLGVTGGDIAIGTKTGATLAISGAVKVESGKAIQLTADGLAVTGGTGTLDTGTGTLDIRTRSAGIGLGLADAGELAVTPGTIAAITTGTLALTATGGAITLRDTLDTTTAAKALQLNADKGVVLTSGTLSATSLQVSTAAGGLTQDAAGLLSAGLLSTVPGGLTGPVSLGNAGNSITKLGPIIASETVAITSGTAMTVTDAIKATGIALVGGAAGGTALSLAGTGSLTLPGAGTIALGATGAAASVELAGTVNATAGGTLLLTEKGAVNQVGGVITAGTVATTGTIAAASLVQPGNAIGTLADATVLGALALTSSLPLSTGGITTVGTATLASSAAAAGAITLTAGTKLAVTAGSATLAATDAAGGIKLAGDLDAGVAALDLRAGTGGVAQTAGTITAGILTSTGDIGGAATLTQTNAIGGLGALNVAGTLALVSSAIVDVSAPVAGNGIALTANGMVFSATGALSAATGTIEIGPLSAGTAFRLGSTLPPTAFNLGDLKNVTAALLRIGKVADGPEAASIALDGVVDPAVTTLDLVSAGAITQAAGGLSVPLLTASAASLDLNGDGNTIDALGTLAVTGLLAVATQGTLAVDSALTAASIRLRSTAADPNALSIGGTLTTTADGTVALEAKNGGIALSGTVDATATGTIALEAGNGGIAQTAGKLTAAVLQGKSQGAVTLDQTGNAIAALGTFDASGFDLTLRSGNSLDVSGPVSAANATIRGADVKLSGSLTASGSALLAATDATGGIVLAGNASVANTLTLSAGLGGIAQPGGGISAGTLAGTSAGKVALDQEVNSIGTLADFSVTGAPFSLTDSIALAVDGAVLANAVRLTGNAADANAISVTGSVTTGGGAIALAAGNGGIALSGTLSATGAGTLDLVAGANGIAQSGGAITAGQLQGSSKGGLALSAGANSISKLGDFAATGDLALTGTIALEISGAVKAASASVVAPSMVLSGAIDAGTDLALTAGKGGIVQTTGSISAPTLVLGVTGGSVALAGTDNAISALTAASVTGGTLTLTTSKALSLPGAVLADAITLTSTAGGTAINLAGSLTNGGGGAITLAAPAGSILLAGDVAATGGILDLSALGSVSQTAGSITAATLRNGAVIGGDLSLTSLTNAITSVGTLTVTGAVVLQDSVPLDIAGVLTANAVKVSGLAASASAITVSGTASATTTMTLSTGDAAGGIALSGTVSAGTLDVSAGTGGIVQSGGSIAATVLKSSGGSKGSVALAETGNAVGTLGAFDATGQDFALQDSLSLTVAGPLRASSVNLRSSAAATKALDITGNITAGFLFLKASDAAGGIALSGDLVSSGIAQLTAGSGGVVQSAGSYKANVLSASAVGGSVVLTQPGNSVVDLIGGTVTGGDFSLTSSSFFSVGGVTADNVALRSVFGDIITKIAGVATNAAGTILLDAAGVIELRAPVKAGGGTVDLRAAAISQNADGVVTAGTLTSGGTIGGAVLLDKADNSIATIGSLVANGDIALRSVAALTIATVLSGANVSVTDTSAATVALTVAPGAKVQAGAGGSVVLSATGGMSLAGTLDATTSGTMTLTAGGGVSQTGGTITAGALAMIAGGDLALAGTVDATAAGAIALKAGGVFTQSAGGITAGALDFASIGGAATQSGGSIAAGILGSSGGIGGPVTLGQAGNAIGTLGAMTITGGGLTLVDSSALNIAGALKVVGGDVTVASSAGGGGTIGVNAPIEAGGRVVSLTASAPDSGIVIADNITADTLNLVAGSGGVVQTGGVLTLVGTLASTGIGGAASFNQASNSIGTIGAFSLAGSFSLVDQAALTVAGPLTAGGGISLVSSNAANPAITVSGTMSSGAGMPTTIQTASGGIAITGQVNVPGGLLTLVTADGVDATSGNIAVGRLAAKATVANRNIVLTGKGNAVGILNSAILEDGTFLLDSNTPLTIAGPITARLLGINVTGSLNVLDGVAIMTEGRARALQYPSVLDNIGIANLNPDAASPEGGTGKFGSFMAVKSASPGKIEIGEITITPFKAAKATFDLILPNVPGGTITLGQVKAPSTDLILVSRFGGSSKGSVEVLDLLVLGAGGTADLSGKIGGLEGQAAASKATIWPQPSSDYRFNACPITSINCVLLPVQTIPPISPLRDVPIIRDRPSQDDADVQLPNVSDEDY